MTTPFDEAIAEIKRVGYHNHRKESHSDTVSNGIIRDLEERCEPLRIDLETGKVKKWLNEGSPGDRERKADLLVGEPDVHGKPDMTKVRVALENKSVITAHRNATSRFDDLQKVMRAVHGAQPEAVIVATILIGLAERVLNVADQVAKPYKRRRREFETTILPRLSTGDSTLWDEFPLAISYNKPGDAAKTVKLFQTLPTRGAGQSHIQGYDYVLLVPVTIDNVNAPALARKNSLKLDVDREYSTMLDQLCRAYKARWHM